MCIKGLVKLCVFCSLIFIVNVSAYADDKLPSLNEQKIKAGLVYNLIKYTEWPKKPNDQVDNKNATKLKICLFGDDAFDGYLSPLDGRTAQQAVISIVHVTEIPQTDHCSVVIIHRNQEPQLKQLLQFLHGKDILTISDIVEFAEQGGMVELTRLDEKIGLQINKGSLDSANLRVDPNMLKLAKIVQNKGGV